MVDPALTPAPAPVARFRADLEVLTGDPPTTDRRLGIAVSGGGDSLALLLLAAAAYPGAVMAATVDHGLRAESAAEAAMVGDMCARLAVVHTVLRVADDFSFGGNVQDRARTARYALLAGWAAGEAAGRTTAGRVAWIATGHQQDDVAEGFLMRARRGAGIGGLAMMRASRPLSPSSAGPLLVRPLLGWSRAALARIVADAGVIPASDPSNADPRFDRSRLRALIGAEPDLPAAHLALAARNLRDAEDALAWVAAREWAARHAIESDGTLLLDVAGLPHDTRRRLVERSLGAVRSGSDPVTIRRGAALDRFVRLLEAGRAATLAGVLARPGERWRFTPAPPRRSA
ncbi:MAG: tRNA lysidine(34) synthetase TilS [Janthinobacterium lividum]